MSAIRCLQLALFLVLLVMVWATVGVAPCLAADAGMVTADAQEPASFDRLLSYLQNRSRNLLMTRGLQPALTESLNADTLRKKLLPGECLYALSEDESVGYSIWVVSESGWIQHREPTKLQTVTTALTAWKHQQVSLAAVTARAPTPRGAQRTQSVEAKPISSPIPSQRQITNWLFPQQLKPTLNACMHLTLQLPGNMAALPWAALPFTEHALLIDQFSVSVLPDIHALAPSANLGHMRIPNVTYALENALIVGNPRYEDSEWLFPDLPGAKRESMSVAKEMGQASSLLLGQQATKLAMLTELRRQTWDMVYLATHAVADLTEPLDRSFVALTPSDSLVNDAGTGRWTAREVQGLKLKADLAVLSACQTGLGGTHDAGVIGIGRAFFLAGIPHVITSLWNVDDDATADLMTRFVQQVRFNIKPRYFPADSLRQAMLQARQTGKPISHWASFIHFGLANVFIQPD